MASRSSERHRQQKSSQQGRRTDVAVGGAAVPISRPQRTAMRAGAVAAGTLVAGATLLGAAQPGGSNPAQFLDHRDSDVALTAAGASFLQGLLDAITIDVNGTPTPLGTSTLDTVVGAFPQLGSLDMATLLSYVGLDNGTTTTGLTTTVTGLLDVLNIGQLQPINDVLTLLGLTGASTVSGVLSSFDVNGVPIGTIPLDSMLATLPVPSGDAPLSDATTLATLLADFPVLGNLRLPAISLLGVTLSSPDLSSLVNVSGYGGETLGQLFDFTSTTDLSGLATQLGIGAVSVDSLLADLGTGASGVALTGSSTVDDIANFLGFGSQTLGDLLPGGLTNSSTLVDLLNDVALVGNIGTETIDQLLGLTPVAAASITDAATAMLTSW